MREPCPLRTLAGTHGIPARVSLQSWTHHFIHLREISASSKIFTISSQEILRVSVGKGALSQISRGPEMVDLLTQLLEKYCLLMLTKDVNEHLRVLHACIVYISIMCTCITAICIYIFMQSSMENILPFR